MTHDEARAFVMGGRTPGFRRVPSKRMTHLTRGIGCIQLYYWGTPVVTWHDDGTFELCTNGWYTATTKARINEFSPVYVYSMRGHWFVSMSYGPLPFRDGMQFRLAPPDSPDVWEPVMYDEEVA